jgi:elongator complex protein 1
MAYVERHRLYDAALSIWKETERYHVRRFTSAFSSVSHSAFQSVLNIYGDWLFERHDFKQAALGNN